VIAIDITEELSPYSPIDRERWCNPEWWASGQWRQVLPEPEWYRVAKFRNQAGRGYHFVEVLQMRALAEQGANWAYENFDFFVPPGLYSKVFRKGYDLITDVFGTGRLQLIQDLARKYAPDAKVSTPDLFAYQTEESTTKPVAFIELKHTDPVSDAQLLGLGLVQQVFETPVRIVRYFDERQTGKLPKRYQREFWSI
jgi:hypothetical protein